MATWTDVVSVENIEAAKKLLQCGMVKQHIQGTIVRLVGMVPENGTFVLSDNEKTCMQIKNGVVTLFERR